MELFYLILIGLTILAILSLSCGIKMVKDKKKMCIGMLLIILGIIMLLFVINDYLILISKNLP